MTSRHPARIARQVLAGLLLALGLVAGMGWSSVASATPAAPAVPPHCSTASLSRQEAVDQLHEVRVSIDETLRLLDAGDREAAFAEAKDGYLGCFESVEAPLDVVAGIDFRVEVETVFAQVRGLIKADASTGEVRDRIVELRGKIDDAERQLTEKGVGAPAIAFTQSFTLLLREGLEAVLLLSVLLTYLEQSEHARHKRPILYGVAAAVVATIVTFFAVDLIFSVLPFGREVLEAITGLLAVAMLFYVSFWLLARLDQRRRLEFLQARVWKAASVGSAASLAFIGFTAVYREGFETVLFYQALFSYGPGLQSAIFLGIALASVALAIVAWMVLKLGRTLPVGKFLKVALIIVMATSVAVIGNAFWALQQAAILDVHFLDGWPILPIYLAQVTGYYPTFASVLAQAILISIYAIGAVAASRTAKRRRRLSVPAPTVDESPAQPVTV